MKYWAWIDNQVKGPYEKDELLVLPGFTNETLIQEYIPEGGEQQWLCAYNFFDVQEVITQTSHNIQQDSLVQQPSPEPEIYQEDTDAKSVAAQFNTVQKESSPHENLEITLLEKLEYLTREIHELKQEIVAVTQKILKDEARMYSQNDKDLSGIAPVSSNEEVVESHGRDELVAPVLEPAKDTVHEEQAVGDTDVEQKREISEDNFLSDVVNINAQEESKLEESEEVKAETQKTSLDPIDLTKFRRESQNEQQQAVIEAQEQTVPTSADQNLVEEKSSAVSEMPQISLPLEEELQAEELQAEPYAGENLSESEKVETTTEEGEGEKYTEHIGVADVKLEETTQHEETAADADVLAAAPNNREDAVLKEFAAEKDIELPESKQKEEDNFVILENNEEEHTATSLEELTSRVDVGKDVNAASADAQLKSVQSLEDDKFLKTFTTGIEEVFMDQPTSVISDYIPPSVSGRQPLPGGVTAAGDEGAGGEIQDIKKTAATVSLSDAGNLLEPNAVLQVASRIKPTNIKTVPLVSSGESNSEQDIDRDVLPQVDEVIVEAQESPIFGIVKVFFGIVGLVITALLIVALLAWMSVIPVKYSPAHNILSKIMSRKKTISRDVSAPAQQTTDAYSMLGNEHENTITTNADTMSQQIIIRVKNYLLIDGLTVEEKINILHPTVKDQIQWTADAAVDPDYYSVAAKLPPNNAGYSLTYRFSYNIMDHTLTPTTSETNNLINSPQPAVRP
ncbi:MAG: hypothetical protein LBG46_02300 [Elusimicrobiota bacterium]|jgi:hypothetical protein|nr:hypothetical protein [Elusimicrobiota bacterium]